MKNAPHEVMSQCRFFPNNGLSTISELYQGFIYNTYGWQMKQQLRGEMKDRIVIYFSNDEFPMVGKNCRKRLFLFLGVANEKADVLYSCIKARQHFLKNKRIDDD